MLVVFGAIIGVPVAAVCVLLPQARRRGPAVRVRHAAGRARLRQPAVVVVDPVPRAERPHRRRLDSLPAGDVGPQAGRGLQDRRPGAADRASRHHPRLLRHPQPRRRARPRGAADRDRQRHGRARRAPDQARCAADGERRDRRRRELRRDRDAARLAARRCIPDDGGRRARRRADGDGARARAARRRHRVADLHRPRRAGPGFGTFSLAVPDIPPVGSPTGAEFLWAIAIGVLAAFLGTGIRRLALALQPIVAAAEPRADPARGRRRSASSS